MSTLSEELLQEFGGTVAPELFPKRKRTTVHNVHTWEADRQAWIRGVVGQVTLLREGERINFDRRPFVEYQVQPEEIRAQIPFSLGWNLDIQHQKIIFERLARWIP